MPGDSTIADVVLRPINNGDSTALADNNISDNNVRVGVDGVGEGSDNTGDVTDDVTVIDDTTDSTDSTDDLADAYVDTEDKNLDKMMEDAIIEDDYLNTVEVSKYVDQNTTSELEKLTKDSASINYDGLKMYEEAEVIDQSIVRLEKKERELTAKAERTKNKKDKERLFAEAQVVNQKIEKKQREKEIVNENAVKLEKAIFATSTGGEPESEKQLAYASVLYDKAKDLKERGKELRDSVETIKKKSEKEAAIAMAEDIEAKSKAKRKEAKDAEKFGEELKVVEAEVINMMASVEKQSVKEEIETFTVNKELTDQEKSDVQGSDEFANYQTMQEDKKRLFQEAVVQYHLVDLMNEKAKFKEGYAARLLASTDTITDPERKARVIREAEVIDVQARETKTQADSLLAMAKKREAYSKAKQEQSEEYLANIDPTKATI